MYMLRAPPIEAETLCAGVRAQSFYEACGGIAKEHKDVHFSFSIEPSE
jgi:hypothetical protein